MNTKQATTWIWGAVLVAAVVAAAAWFALLSPLRSSTADLREQTESLESANDQKELRIARLAQQAEGLDTLKADLANLRTQVTADDGMSEYLRELDAIAKAHSVTIVSVIPAEPSLFAPVSTAQTDTTLSGAGVSDTASDSSTSEDPTDTTTAASSSSAPAGMVAIPVIIDVVGHYSDAVAFVGAVQQETARLALVTSVSGVGQEDNSASAGRPATSVGDVEVTISGSVFVLPDSSATAVAADDATPTLPAEVPGKNPLIPVG